MCWVVKDREGRVFPWALQVGQERTERWEQQRGFEVLPQDLGLGVRSDRLGENFRGGSGEERSGVRGPVTPRGG